jgi:glycosyltransferase involved in cell wall biosynthesis
MSEVAQDAAFLVDPNNEATITDALAQIIHASSLINELIDRGSKRAQLFNWTSVAKKTKAVYSLF